MTGRDMAQSTAEDVGSWALLSLACTRCDLLAHLVSAYLPPAHSLPKSCPLGTAPVFTVPRARPTARTDLTAMNASAERSP